MAEGEVAALKESLCNQYITIRKLHDELEEERDASETATSEALSMILRLQREKAAEKMEACQYKRVAEEKLHYVEESLEILEEVMQHKEMEIALLRYQLQACNRGFLNVGIDFADVEDLITSENPSLCSSYASLDKNFLHGFIRRNASFPSLPSLRLDMLCHEMQFFCEDNSLTRQKILRKIDNCTKDLSKKFEIERSAKQAEKLQKKVEELVHSENIKEEVRCESSSSTKLLHLRSSSNEIQSSLTGKGLKSRSASNDSANLNDVPTPCSWYSAMSSNRSYFSAIGGIRTELDDEGSSCSPPQVENSEDISSNVHFISCPEAEKNGIRAHPMHVHDKFELLECQKGCSPGEPYKEMLEESIPGTKNTIKICDFVQQEDANYLLTEDNLVNKSDPPTNSGNKLSKQRNGCVHLVNKLPTQKEGSNNVDRQRAFADPTDVEQLKGRLQQLEDESFGKQEGSEIAKKQLELLGKISEHLNLIETHLKASKPKKFPQKEESSVISIMEAVLSFSI